MSGNKKWSLAGLAALCLFAGSASLASAGEDIARQEAPSKAYLDFYGEEDPSSVPATGDVMEPLFVAEELLQSLPKPEEVKTVGNLKLKKEDSRWEGYEDTLSFVLDYSEPVLQNMEQEAFIEKWELTRLRRRRLRVLSWGLPLGYDVGEKKELSPKSPADILGYKEDVHADAGNICLGLED